MRILNIVFNTEIKYQQHINSENINTKIYNLAVTLEKPTRGKPVREVFDNTCTPIEDEHLQ
jgi:hypothetical protein